uniref:Uncharacterized protein n=1 Tax=Arundo donax TaxID=35708 RepID=A0A0A9GN95_ARUDO
MVHLGISYCMIFGTHTCPSREHSIFLIPKILLSHNTTTDLLESGVQQRGFWPHLSQRTEMTWLSRALCLYSESDPYICP